MKFVKIPGNSDTYNHQQTEWDGGRGSLKSYMGRGIQKINGVGGER